MRALKYANFHHEYYRSCVTSCNEFTRPPVFLSTYSFVLSSKLNPLSSLKLAKIYLVYLWFYKTIKLLRLLYYAWVLFFAGSPGFTLCFPLSHLYQKLRTIRFLMQGGGSFANCTMFFLPSRQWSIFSGVIAQHPNTRNRKWLRTPVVPLRGQNQWSGSWYFLGCFSLIKILLK